MYPSQAISAADRPVYEPRGTNVTPLERWLSGLAGVMAFSYGLRRPTFVGLGSTLLGADLIHRAVTGNCMLYKLYDFTLPRRDTLVGERVPHGIAFETSVVIHRPLARLFGYWRNPSELPVFSGYDGEAAGGQSRRYQGMSNPPFRPAREWKAAIADIQDNRFVSWVARGARGLESGAVTFTPVDPDSTEVTLRVSYHPPGGRPAAAINRLLGEDPRRRIRATLLEFKQWVESGSTGPLPSASGQPVH